MNYINVDRHLETPLTRDTAATENFIFFRNFRKMGFHNFPMLYGFFALLTKYYELNLYNSISDLVNSKYFIRNTLTSAKYI